MLRERGYERVVSVKGLVEREVPADIAVSPMLIILAPNDVAALCATMEEKTKTVLSFEEQAFPIRKPPRRPRGSGYIRPAIWSIEGRRPVDVPTCRNGPSWSDRFGQGLLEPAGGTREKGEGVRRRGLERKDPVFFTKFFGLKPERNEEAIRNTRAVAERFAADSQKVGRRKRASQGRFTIEDRDTNRP